MKMRWFIFIILAFCCQAVFALDLRLDDSFSNFISVNPQVIDSTDVFRATAINLLDKDPKTFSLVYYNPRQNEGRNFELSFSGFYPFDSIAFETADFLPGQRFFRVKEIEVSIYSNTPTYRKETLRQAFALEDSSYRQEFALAERAYGNQMVLRVLSVYWDESSSGSAMGALGEAEFLFRGTAYKTAALGEVKSKFLKEYRDSKISYLKKMFFYIRETGWGTNGQAILHKWARLGVDAEAMNPFMKNKEMMIHLELTLDNPLAPFDKGDNPLGSDSAGSSHRFDKGEIQGKIIAGRKNGRLSWEKLGEKYYHYHFTDGVLMGYWKLDESGTLWVKIGNGEWKKEVSATGSFYGTDMEGLGSVLGVEF
jgi:hypothetical protein